MGGNGGRGRALMVASSLLGVCLPPQLRTTPRRRSPVPLWAGGIDYWVAAVEAVPVPRT